MMRQFCPAALPDCGLKPRMYELGPVTRSMAAVFPREIVSLNQGLFRATGWGREREQNRVHVLPVATLYSDQMAQGPVVRFSTSSHCWLVAPVHS